MLRKVPGKRSVAENAMTVQPVKNGGVALVYAILLMLVIGIVIGTGSQLLMDSLRETRHRNVYVAQAENIARSGVMYTLDWFRKQNVQPVAAGRPPTTTYAWADGAFHPRYSVDPAVSATIDESIGIVQEFQLPENPAFWGRYEVHRQTCPPSVWRNPYAARDITEERFFLTGDRNGDGLAWYVEAVGYLWRKQYSTDTFTTDKILGRARVATEFVRMPLRLPQVSALVYTYDGGGAATPTVHVSAGWFDAGYGYVFARSTGTAPNLAGGTFKGAANSIQISTAVLYPTVEYVFGLSQGDLKNVADVYYEGSLPAAFAGFPTMSLAYLELNGGTVTFNASRRLSGSGVLFVNGHIVMQDPGSGTSHTFSGLIYATGHVAIRTPCTVLLTGLIIADRGFYCDAAAAEITYDTYVVNVLRKTVGQYRENKASYHVFRSVR